MEILRRYRFIFALVATAVIALGAGAYVSASTSAGSGKIKGFEGVQTVTLPDNPCTSSFPDFEDMPGMVLSFDGSGPVVVLFQGQFGDFTSTPDARAAIRFTIDGNIVGSAIAIGNDHGQGLQTFGFNAFSGPLGKGTHELKVLWHTSPAGAMSCVEERSLIVLEP